MVNGNGTTELLTTTRVGVERLVLRKCTARSSTASSYRTGARQLSAPSTSKAEATNIGGRAAQPGTGGDDDLPKEGTAACAPSPPAPAALKVIPDVRRAPPQPTPGPDVAPQNSVLCHAADPGITCYGK
jgi:hypothetical protein